MFRGILSRAGVIIGFLALAAWLALPGGAAADDLEGLDAVEWAEQFDALWSIEDPKLREKRATELATRIAAYQPK